MSRKGGTFDRALQVIAGIATGPKTPRGRFGLVPELIGIFPALYLLAIRTCTMPKRNSAVCRRIDFRLWAFTCWQPTGKECQR